LLAEFADVNQVVRAARAMRQAGYRQWDVHSPFPIHGIDRVMGIRPTVLPRLVLVGGIVGCLGGLGLAWYANAFSYPYLISGKPIFSWPANIPVIFETTVLLAAMTAVFGMLILNELPLLYNPLFKSDRFRRVTNDRFFVSIKSSDPKFDLAETSRFLKAQGASVVEEVLY
jgi:hypothetical protein